MTVSPYQEPRTLKRETDFLTRASLPAWAEPDSLSGAKQAILSLGRTMHEHAYLVGKHLLWVKGEVGHGEFLLWLETNVKLFSHTTGTQTQSRWRRSWSIVVCWSRRAGVSGCTRSWWPTRIRFFLIEAQGVRVVEGRKDRVAGKILQ